ncbi:FGGY-family carbohydrate kinase [Rhizobium sp. YIM 134829]|uniref:FGGY-family carbohydrate kinase n=1 Tax=Rhizobium sp. YIM 134829 TaxID=3390453 RepID=UPI00397B7050
MTDSPSALPLKRVAVLDIGKTNAKLVVLDAATGEELAVRRTRNVTRQDGPYPHYDTDALWAFACGALAEFARDPGFDAISITAHGAAAALLAKDGTLALPVLDYEYEYPDPVRAAYRSLRPGFEESFSPAQSMGLNLGAQLHYQSRGFPDDFARVATILTYPQYWAYRLTGVAANEVTSLGCHTDLWCPREARYSTLVDRLGIRDRLAPLRSAFDVLGPVEPVLAARLGLTEAVRVHCGIHDSNASLLPHLMTRSGAFSVVSTGTWVVGFAIGGDLDHLDPDRDTLANVDAFARPVPSARFMGGREYETLAAEIGPAEPEAIAAALPAVLARSIMLLPNFVEGSGPFPGRRGRWINEKGASPAERHAAVALYLALMTEASLSLLGRSGPIIVEGPFAANVLYLRALAALTGAEIIAAAGSTGTSAGAALLTGIAPPPATGQRVEAAGLSLAAYRQNWYAAMAPAPADAS